jgi:pimeloyl-ACP methyl ester carboxylesterase
VVAGALDRVTPSSEQQALAALLPKSKYVEIPAGSHNVQLDFGEYVGLKVEEFWRERKLE